MKINIEKLREKIKKEFPEGYTIQIDSFEDYIKEDSEIIRIRVLPNVFETSFRVKQNSKKNPINSIIQRTVHGIKDAIINELRKDDYINRIIIQESLRYADSKKESKPE